MFSAAHGGYTCSICGDSSPHLPIITSNMFTTKPVICEKCLFEKILHHKLHWKQEILEMITSIPEEPKKNWLEKLLEKLRII